MARLWPKGWIGSKQAPEEDSGDAEVRRRDPAAGWPWIPRPAAAGAAGVAAPVVTSEMKTSPVVEQLQMAAASTGSKRKRGLGRRPQLESEATETAASNPSGQPEVAAQEQAPIPSEETMAKSEDPKPESTTDEAPTGGAAETEAQSEETIPVPVGVGPGEEADQTQTEAAQDTGDAQSEAGAEGAVAGLAALAGASAPARGWRRWLRRSAPADEEAGWAEDASEPQAEAGGDAGEAAKTEEGAPAEAAGVAAMAGAGAAAGGWQRWLGVAPGPDGRRNWLGTKQVAAVVLLLLAAEIGYVVNLNVSSSSNKTATPPPLSTLPPVKSSPAVTVPTTVPPAPKTAPASSPSTTVAPAHPVAAPVVQAAAAPLGPCTPSDLNITTSTGQSSYSVGQAVNILTTVTAVHSCIFQPAPAGPYSCASSIVVASGGNQVWPAPGQAEPCNAPPGMTMNPGSTESLSGTWTASSAGTYQAIGMWGWSGGSGQPTNTANVASPAFTVS